MELEQQHSRSQSCLTAALAGWILYGNWPMRWSLNRKNSTMPASMSAKAGFSSPVGGKAVVVGQNGKKNSSDSDILSSQLMKIIFV